MAMSFQKQRFASRQAGALVATLAAFGSGCGMLLGLDEFTDQASVQGPALGCADGRRGGDETSIDCGGSCDPCSDGQGCMVGADCQSRVCQRGTCLAPACEDEIRNGSESDADCGGKDCDPCQDGRACVAATDCKSGICSEEICRAPTCDDNTQNAAETDIDCGGGECAGCAPNRKCTAGSDCESGICELESCANNHIWSQGFSGDASQTGERVAITSLNHIHLFGRFEGTITMGNEAMTNPCARDPMDQVSCYQHWFLASFRADGNHSWHRHITSRSEPDYESFNVAFALGSTGESLLISHGSEPFDFGGGPIPDPSPCQPPQCNFDVDTSIAVLGSDGRYRWGRTYGDANNQYGWDITATTSGALAAVGCFSGSINFGGTTLSASAGYDVFVAKLRATNGAHDWSTRFDSSGTACARSVTSDGAGNIILAGYFSGTINLGGTIHPSAGNSDIFIAKLSPNGGHLWSERFGDVQEQATKIATRWPHDKLKIITDRSGNIILAGSLSGGVNFGGSLLADSGTSGAKSIFIAKFDPEGNHLWSTKFGDETSQSTARVVLGDVATSIDGSVVISGHHDIAIDFGGGRLLPGGFIIKLTADGTYAWGKSFQGSIQGIAPNDMRQLVITGSAPMSADFGGGPLDAGPVFLAKLRTP